MPPALHLEKDQLTLAVQIFDTDCFGVVWHGAYTKWLEMGRVEFLRSRGIALSKPGDREGLVYPVVEQHFRFRAPARFGDTLTLTTQARLEGSRLIFTQTCRTDAGVTTLETTTVNAVVDGATWRPLRRLPEVLTKIL